MVALCSCHGTVEQTIIGRRTRNWLSVKPFLVLSNVAKLVLEKNSAIKDFCSSHVHCGAFGKILMQCDFAEAER